MFSLNQDRWCAAYTSRVQHRQVISFFSLPRHPFSSPSLSLCFFFLIISLWRMIPRKQRSANRSQNSHRELVYRRSTGVNGGQNGVEEVAGGTEHQKRWKRNTSQHKGGRQESKRVRKESQKDSTSIKEVVLNMDVSFILFLYFSYSLLFIFKLFLSVSSFYFTYFHLIKIDNVQPFSFDSWSSHTSLPPSLLPSLLWTLGNYHQRSTPTQRSHLLFIHMMVPTVWPSPLLPLSPSPPLPLSPSHISNYFLSRFPVFSCFLLFFLF